MKFNFKHIALALLGGATLFSCDLDEKFYSSVTPDTFITCPENTYAILCRPFTHWKWYLGAERWYLQELTTDEMVCPTRGNDFYNNGEYIRLQEHTWTGDDRHVKNVWDGTMSAIARTLEAKEDLSGVNYDAIGLSDEIKKDHINQLNAILGWYYMRGLDYFGGLPIFRSNNDAPCARSTDKETFEFCEDLFKNAIPSILPKSSLGEAQDGYIKKAAAAMMLAELYFNAEAYGGGDRYADCAAICEDLIRGEYGPYAIDNTWYGPHCFDNDKSTEAVWYVPSQNSKMEFNWYYRYFYNHQADKYFNCPFPASRYNGFILSPSREKEGGPVMDYKLGKSYEKYNDADLRKKPYVYHGNKEYEGMFCVGLQKNPYTGEVAIGQKDMAGKPVVLVDYVNITGNSSTMMDGSESSGVRLVKMPIPNIDDKDLLWNPDYPCMRFTEVYYMLAECKWRAGDKKGAAQLINKVRKRNFANGNDPDPVTETNLDVYRMADEWQIEFLGEGRRRTDLIRLGLYTTESWWAHKPTDDTKKRFPLPSEAMAGNPLLKQNPGY